MKYHSNCLGIQSQNGLPSVAEQLRFMSIQERRRQQNRQLSMLYRLASEVGTDIE